MEKLLSKIEKGELGVTNKVNFATRRFIQDMEKATKELDITDIGSPYRSIKHKFIEFIGKSDKEDIKEEILPLLDAQFSKEDKLRMEYLGLRRIALAKLDREAIDIILANYEKAKKLDPKKQGQTRSSQIALAETDLEALAYVYWPQEAAKLGIDIKNKRYLELMELIKLASEQLNKIMADERPEEEINANFEEPAKVIPLRRKL